MGGGGTIHCGTCATLWNSTLFLSVPSLGIARAPMAWNFANGWNCCVDVPVLGYAACASFVTAKSTVTAGFFFHLQCGGLIGWGLTVQYKIAESGFADGSSGLGDTFSRAADLTCTSSGIGCPNTTFSFGTGEGDISAPGTCTFPLVLNFSGGWTMTGVGGNPTPVNNYLGTSASIVDI